MEVFLVLNGFQMNAAVDEQERVILQVVSSELGLYIRCSTLSNAGNHTE
jgi:prophage maintenance system killer protein